jgi:two-component system LytT family response regulator
MSAETITTELIHWTRPAPAPARVPATWARRLALKVDGRFIFIDAAAVDWIESAGNYICVHAGADTHIVREALTRFAERLDPQRFRRIHRTTVINVEHVRELRPYFRGDYVVVLNDGTERILSRRYRDHFLAAVTHGL